MEERVSNTLYQLNKPKTQVQVMDEALCALKYVSTTGKTILLSTVENLPWPRGNITLANQTLELQVVRGCLAQDWYIHLMGASLKCLLSISRLLGS